MANLEARYRDPTAQNPSKAATSGGSGVCMMSTTWRDEQHPSFINFISSFLSANSFRLNFVPIAPDFIFNCGGLSVAFIFVTNLDCKCISPMFSRVQKLKGQFAHLYVVVVLPTKEQNELFVHSYFKYGMELGKPTFVPVEDLEMGFEKIVKIAISRGVCKRQDVITKLKAERKQSVQAMDVFLQVLTSIPGIENHDANALNQAIGSIEAIAKASKEYILQNTDLSADKAEIISRFFRDPNFYMSPKINRSEKQGHVNSMLKLADFIHDCLVRYTDIETCFSCYPGFQFKTVSDGLSADHPRSLDKFMELDDSLNSKTKPLLREMLVSNQLGSNTRPSLTCIIVDGLISIFTSDMPMTLIYYFHFSLNKQINYQIFPQSMGESATSHY